MHSEREIVQHQRNVVLIGHFPKLRIGDGTAGTLQVFKHNDCHPGARRRLQGRSVGGERYGRRYHADEPCGGEDEKLCQSIHRVIILLSWYFWPPYPSWALHRGEAKRFWQAAPVARSSACLRPSGSTGRDP